MISTDIGLLDPNSKVSKRMKKYGKTFDNLEIVVFSLFSSPSGEENIKYENVTIYPTNSRTRWLYVLDALRIGNKIKDIDIISSQDISLTGIVACLLSKKNKIKFQAQIHTDIFSKKYWQHSIKNKIEVIIGKKVIKYADLIRVVSKRIENSLSKIKTKKEVRIHNLPVFILDGNILNLKEESEINLPFTYNILTVGRLESEKNIILTLKAFNSISKKYPESGLIVVGIGRLKKQLEIFIKENNLEERVRFVGAVNNIEDYYLDSDVYIQTSKYEGYGMALAEAALYKLPILTTDVGLVGEVLIDGGSCMVTNGSVEDTSRILENLLRDQELRESLGNRAKENALNNLDIEEDYLRKYKESFNLKNN